VTAGRRAGRPIGLLVAALSLLALAAVRGGGGGPALYDGICLPPHYLTLGGNPPPASATATYTADALNQTQELATGEATPQAQIIIAQGTFTAPAGSSVTVTLTPVPAPSTKPSDGTIVGNVYEFAARSSAGQALQPAPGHPPTVVLEAPSSGGPQLTLERYGGSSWAALKTFQSGCGDTEEAASPTLGLFALVAAGSTPGGSGSSGGGAAGGGAPTLLIVIGAAVVVLAAIIGALRLARRSR
jgi:hypothetical protein